MSTPLEQRPFVVDHCLVTCKGCGGERKFLFDPHLRSAQEFIDWHKSGGIAPCDCGAATCDVKLHVPDPN